MERGLKSIINQQSLEVQQANFIILSLDFLFFPQTVNKPVITCHNYFQLYFCLFKLYFLLIGCPSPSFQNSLFKTLATFNMNMKKHIYNKKHIRNLLISIMNDFTQNHSL